MKWNRPPLWIALLGTASLILSSCSTGHKTSGSFRHGKNRYQWRHETYASTSGNWRGGRGRGHHRIKSDVPLDMNDKVASWIDYFTGSGRGWFERSLSRSGQYMDMMRAALRRKGLPEDLVYVAMIESGFVNQARSRAAAVGTWQFIQSTGRLYGLDINSWVDERRDPEKAVEAAVNFFSDLYREFGDWYLAMAAYNGGPGRVRNAIAATGSNNFWDLAAPGRNVLRPETRDYVPKYIAATMIAKDPERYGFHRVAYKAPWRYDVATIHEQTDLGTIAEAANVGLDTVADLNPELRGGVTPPGRYSVRLPAGTAKRFAREFRRVANDRRIEVATYKARRGDTVDRVAKRFGVTSERLLAYNQLKGNKLRPGERLEVPVRKRGRVNTNVDIEQTSDTTPEASPAAVDVSAEPTTADVASYEPASANTPASSVDTAATTQNIAPDARWASVVTASAPTYRVRRGDTLARVARKTGVAVADLRRWNQLENNSVTMGQELRLTPVESTPLSPDATTTVAGGVDTPTVEGFQATESGIAPVAATAESVVAPRPVMRAALPDRYTVRRGDVLSVVARRHGVTVADLRRWNQLSSNELKVGQQLRLSAGRGESTTASLDPRVLPAASRPVTSPAKGTYTVRKGDTLTEIAQRHGLTVGELRGLNQQASVGTLRPGQQMTIRKGASAARPTATTTAKATPKGAGGKARQVVHKVKPGDTIWDLSKVYKVSPTQIKTWNRLSQNTLRPGQKLTIRVQS